MAEIGLVQIVEGALLAAGKPLTVTQLAELFEEHERPPTKDIREALEQVAARCEDRGFELQEVASGFRFQVRQSLSPWVARLWHERPQKYSRALLETLSLIAYRQPITRGEIEEIRGVAVSSSIIKTLHEREWIRVVGHRDVPGRPAMYATTRQFLDYFNLKTLDQLPALAEIRDLETLNSDLGFSEPLVAAAAELGQGEAGGGPGDDSPTSGGPAGGSPTGGSPADGSPADRSPTDGSPADGSPTDRGPELTLVGGTEHAGSAAEASDAPASPAGEPEDALAAQEEAGGQDANAAEGLALDAADTEDTPENLESAVVEPDTRTDSQS
jgi:segregation and condensation protein B